MAKSRRQTRKNVVLNCKTALLSLPQKFHFLLIVFSYFFSFIFFCIPFYLDFMLVFYYFVRNEIQYGVITLTIVIVPSVLCQIYSLWLLRSDSTVSARALMMHILLLGIPYRYQNILHKISHKDKSMHEDEEHAIELIADRIRDVNAIQTVNAIFQYCPQFLFQSFLVVYRHYKYLMTGKMIVFSIQCKCK